MSPLVRTAACPVSASQSVLTVKSLVRSTLRGDGAGGYGRSSGEI